MTDIITKQTGRTLLFVQNHTSVVTWNGDWSGREKVFAKALKVSKKQLDHLKALGVDFTKETHYSFYHEFSDGWKMNIEVYRTDSKEAHRIMKHSAGFNGYDWMINSILNNGEIVQHRKKTYLQKSALQESDEQLTNNLVCISSEV